MKLWHHDFIAWAGSPHQAEDCPTAGYGAWAWRALHALDVSWAWGQSCLSPALLHLSSTAPKEQDVMVLLCEEQTCEDTAASHCVVAMPMRWLNVGRRNEIRNNATWKKVGKNSNLWRVRSRGCPWLRELFLVGSSWKPRYFAMCCAIGCCFARIVGVQQWEVIPAWEGSQEPDLDGSMAVLVHRWNYEQRQALSRAIRSCLLSSPVFVHRANLMFKHQLGFQLHAFWGNS